MTEAMMTSLKAINKWFYFSYNFPYNFIERIWGKKEAHNLSSHLQSKFDYFYEEYGSRAVMNQFYAELDGSNRKKLMEWVMTNYNDECKLTFSEEE